MCFFKLPSSWKIFPQSLHLNIFPQKLQFFLHHMCFLYVIVQIAFGLKIFPTKIALFLHVFFVCVSSNCLWSETFSHKNCNFFFMSFLFVIFQIAFGQKNSPTKVALFSSCVFCMCFFKLPLVRKYSHKNYNFFFICFLYVFLQIAFGLENFPTEFVLKNFPTKVACFVHFAHFAILACFALFALLHVLHVFHFFFILLGHFSTNSNNSTQCLF